MRRIDKIIIHYSATDYARQTAKWIDKIHRKKGFTRGIGYHFFIRQNGMIEVGRGEEMTGAHCPGQNSNSIGICIAAYKVFTIAALRSLEDLIRSLKVSYPNATIHGHNEFRNTLCPGMNIERFKKL